MTTVWDAIQKRLDSMPKPTQTLTMCADPDLRDRYRTAKEAADRAEQNLAALPKDVDKDARALREKTAKAAADELAAVKKDYDAAAVTLTFQALESEQLEELQAKHPAKEEDEERSRDFHFDTFAPALISAASVDGMPLEYAVQAMKTWTLPDREDLWNAAWSAQQRRRTDLGKD